MALCLLHPRHRPHRSHHLEDVVALVIQEVFVRLVVAPKRCQGEAVSVDSWRSYRPMQRIEVPPVTYATRQIEES